MADAWSTVIEREPEYDDFTRSEILALMAWESNVCPKCGNYDSMRPAGKASQHAIGPNGETFEVQFHRCSACGLEELVRREFNDAHKDDHPNASGALASDGLIFIARPHEEDIDV